MKRALVWGVIVAMLAVVLFACGNSASSQATATKPAAPAVTPSQAEALVNDRCTRCHSLDRIKAAKKTPDVWKATVDRMIGHGAQLSAAEESTVVDYLAATYK